MEPKNLWEYLGLDERLGRVWDLEKELATVTDERDRLKAEVWALQQALDAARKRKKKEEKER
jgi:hypothetical protein